MESDLGGELVQRPSGSLDVCATGATELDCQQAVLTGNIVLFRGVVVAIRRGRQGKANLVCVCVCVSHVRAQPVSDGRRIGPKRIFSSLYD